MAWITPPLWIANSVVSSAQMNDNVRGNLLFLHDNRGPLPTSGLVDKDEWVYQVDDGAGILWRVKYDSGGATNRKWEFVGGSPLRSHVPAPGKTGGSTYVSLGATFSVPLVGEYWFMYGVALIATGTNTELLVAPSYAGAAASDGDSAGCGTIQGQPGSAKGVSPLKSLNAGDAVTLMQRDPSATGIGATLVNGHLLGWPTRVN